MSRVAVIAYSARNLGDDLFTTLLVDRYPGASFSFFATSPDALGPLAGRPNVHVMNDKTFRQERFDLLLVLGGSMFQQGAGWCRAWLRYMLRMVWARTHGCPVAIVGISFGPVRSARFAHAYRLVFRLATWISVRDSASAQALRGLPRLHRFSDLAFAHPIAVPRSSAPAVTYAVVSVMDFGSEIAHPRYEVGCVAVIEALAASVPVVLVSFQEYDGIDDGAVIAGIVAQLAPVAQSRVSVLHYNGSNLREVVEAIGDSSLVVGSRLHATLIACATAVPCVAIAYHPKVSDAIESMRLDVVQISPDMLVESAGMIGDLLVDLSARRGDGTIAAQNHRDSAVGHLEYVDWLLADPSK